MEEKADAALALYDKVFENYDFIFVTNLMEAAQIAKFSDKPYKKYLKRGFQFGLKLDHLKNYPIFKDILNELRKDEELQKAYTTGRNIYLKNIDFNYLNWVYELYLRDQIDKKKPNSIYRGLIDLSIQRIKNKIKDKGFPGEWIIGIPDSAIFAEHGTPQLDIKERKKKYGDKLLYCQTDDKAISPTKVFVLLVHAPCAYGKLKDLLWKEMLKGHIHPRSLGMLYDNMSGFYEDYNVTNLCHTPNPKENAYFRLNIFSQYPEPSKVNLKKTDSIRNAFYIVSYKLDKTKKEYQKKYGFRLFPRFWEPFQKLKPAWK